MPHKLPLKEIFKIILPPVLAVVLFIIALFGVIMPSYQTNLMEHQKKMLREMTNIAWQMIAVAEKQEHADIIPGEISKQIVLDHLRGMRYGADNLDYFWVNDMQPVMIMHPYRADLEGQDLSDFSDPNGKKLFLDFVNIAKTSKEGFSEYMWQWKNDASRIEPKLSYIKYFQPWGWVIGTGIYLHDVNRQIDDLSRKLILISSLIIIIVSLLTIHMTRKALQTARNHINAENALKNHQDYLEKLVENRTLDLTQSNQQLHIEISERKTLEEKLFLASITDPLTELYNRRGLHEFAQKQIQLAERQGNLLYLLYMDLNGMKQINDVHGHEMGDNALVEIAHLLKAFFRKSDIICRLGGDEFAVLVVAEKQALDETAFITRFQQHLDSANDAAQRPYKLSISVGIVQYDHQHPSSVEELLSKGDTLMYQHKKQSKSNRPT
ncbi:MAG: diguanylate cyclase [Gammaproteobacteria bacterium]|nr:diguanylate cyclase [Gammaproteobacteria bacterium]MBL6999084.1 diguanylate cyclase [Gammaproteobacteria bacterium]